MPKRWSSITKINGSICRIKDAFDKKEVGDYTITSMRLARVQSGSHYTSEQFVGFFGFWRFTASAVDFFA